MGSSESRGIYTLPQIFFTRSAHVTEGSKSELNAIIIFHRTSQSYTDCVYNVVSYRSLVSLPQQVYIALRIRAHLIYSAKDGHYKDSIAPGQKLGPSLFFSNQSLS